MRFPLRLGLALLLAPLAGCAFGDGSKGSILTAAPDLHIPSLGGGHRAQFVRTVASGKRVLLWGETSLAADCTLLGDTRLEIVEAPYHGSAFVKPGRFYPVYPSGDARAACGAKLAEGMVAFYTAESGFSGQDQVKLRGTAPDGGVSEITVVVDVR